MCVFTLVCVCRLIGADKNGIPLLLYIYVILLLYTATRHSLLDFDRFKTVWMGYWYLSKSSRKQCVTTEDASFPTCNILLSTVCVYVQRYYICYKRVTDGLKRPNRTYSC